MDNLQLTTALYNIGAIKFGDFTLKSGKTSKIYLDLRQIISHPKILQAAANILWQKIRHCQFDLICGVPYTALPIATCISLQHNIPMILRRKEKKTYGTKQQIEGAFQPGQTCLIIEDTVTTGSSIIETADELSAAGLKITDVALLVDREQGSKHNLQTKNFAVHAAFTLKEILQTLRTEKNLPAAEQAIVDTLIHEHT